MLMRKHGSGLAIMGESVRQKIQGDEHFVVQILVREPVVFGAGENSAAGGAV
jgi:hypothetical protein